MNSFDGLTIRRPQTMEECIAISRLQQKVWGFSEIEVTPPDLLLMQVNLGAALYAAVDETTMPVAFVYSFFGMHDGRPMHWSHMLAVLPEYRGRKLGTHLKFRQRQHILQQGADWCRWTFDPLETGNARLNLVTLGAVCHTYKENAYGMLSGPLNAGMPTDRLVADWHLLSDRVVAAEKGKPLRQTVDDSTLAVMLDFDLDKDLPYPRIRQQSVAETVLCRMPLSISTIKEKNMDCARSWRGAVRETFQKLFAEGLQLVDVRTPRETGEPACHYLFTRKKP